MERCQHHSGFEAEIKGLISESKEVWKAIDVVRADIKQIAYRPPVWCTVFIALLSAAVAWGFAS